MISVRLQPDLAARKKNSISILIAFQNEVIATQEDYDKLLVDLNYSILPKISSLLQSREVAYTTNLFDENDIQRLPSRKDNIQPVTATITTSFYNTKVMRFGEELLSMDKLLESYNHIAGIWISKHQIFIMKNSLLLGVNFDRNADITIKDSQVLQSTLSVCNTTFTLNNGNLDIAGLIPVYDTDSPVLIQDKRFLYYWGSEEDILNSLHNRSSILKLCGGEQIFKIPMSKEAIGKNPNLVFVLKGKSKLEYIVYPLGLYWIYETDEGQFIQLNTNLCEYVEGKTFKYIHFPAYTQTVPTNVLFMKESYYSCFTNCINFQQFPKKLQYRLEEVYNIDKFL